MADKNKYKVEYKHPLPREILSDLSWESLVDTIARNGISRVKKVRLNNVGVPTGTTQINGTKMLSLWKAVERKIN